MRQPVEWYKKHLSAQFPPYWIQWLEKAASHTDGTVSTRLGLHRMLPRHIHHNVCTAEYQYRLIRRSWSCITSTCSQASRNPECAQVTTGSMCITIQDLVTNSSYFDVDVTDRDTAAMPVLFPTAQLLHSEHALVHCCRIPTRETVST